MKGIEWKHSPPHSPHWGGVWERIIREAKKHLSVLLGSDTLDVDTFTTVLAEVERILNNRPLTYGSSDVRDLSALTPANFLYPGIIITSSTNILPPAPPSGGSLRHQWQVARTLVDQFWDRWSKEYLHTLQQRQKWQKPRPDLYVGQIVLMKNDTAPRDQWQLARVEETGPSPVRRVTVKTVAGKTFDRHVTQLVALELE